MKREGGGTIVNPGGPGVSPTTVVKDPTKPVQMGVGEGPFVDERVLDPVALNYAKSAEARRRGQLPKYTGQVAGGPDVAIPRLDSEASGMGTMAEQAMQQRSPMPMPNLGALVESMSREPALNRGIVDGSAHQAPPPAPVGRLTGSPPPVAGVQNGDLLPEEATADPAFQRGHGSMFAINQPAMAAKYGVVRNGQRLAPQALAAGAGPRSKAGGPQTTLRQETVDGLAALRRLEEERNRVTSQVEEQQLLDETAAGPAGGAGKPGEKLSEEALQKLLDSLDDYDLDRVRQALLKDTLNNDQQRRIIESRLPPLDLSSLIMTGRITQVVPIQPGILEPEFQSYDGLEDLVIKRLIGEEARATGGSDRYIMDKYRLMGLTIALRSINRQHLPDYLNAEGNFDTDAFWKKYEIVARLNYHMLASLMVNWFWFDTRVRKLLRAEELGNG